MNFSYKAIDKEGERYEGSIEANNKSAVHQQLMSKGLQPIEIKKFEVVGVWKNLFSNTLGLNELEFFTSQLSLLLDSGVKVNKGIEIILKSNAHPALTTLLIKISSSLKKGNSLSEAFEEHPKLFNALYISLLKIGESSGNLSQVLHRLSEDLKFQKDLKSQISQALTYPSVIMVVCLSAVYFVLTFIVPKMSGIFTDLSLAPWYTQMIIHVSNFFVKNENVILGGIAFSGLSLVYMFKQERFKSWFYVKSAKVPGVGKIILTAERIRFASSLAMMLEAGVPLDESFKLTSETLKHPDFKRETKQALLQLKSGKQLSEVLSKTKIFPRFFLSIIQVGEETGSLPRVFNEVASRSRVDLELVIKKLTTLLEPIMLIFMGGFVGGIVISMLMSMVSINDVAF